MNIRAEVIPHAALLQVAPVFEALLGADGREYRSGPISDDDEKQGAFICDPDRFNLLPAFKAALPDFKALGYRVSRSSSKATTGMVMPHRGAVFHVRLFGGKSNMSGGLVLLRLNFAICVGECPQPHVAGILNLELAKC